MQQPIQSYRDLVVWQKATDLVVSVYAYSKTFPPSERFGITTQLRRAAVSIPANIAEGRHRGSRKEFLQFLRYAYSSGAELETHLELIKRIYRIDDAHVRKLHHEVMKMLGKMISKMRRSSA